MRFVFRLTFVSVLVSWTVLGGLSSRASDSGGPVVTVIHIDAMPDYTRAAATLLDQFRRDSLRDPGEKAFLVLQETAHPNHFTLVETWATEAAYEAHNVAAHTRHFRDQIQPMLGSPFDERLHAERNAAP